MERHLNRKKKVFNYPGKSFGLKFIPNQSDSFRFIPKSVSAPIRVNPKKLFNLVWCNSVQNQSVSIRVNPRFLILTKIQSESIRLNPRLSIRMKFLIQMNPRSEWFKRNTQSESIRRIPTSDSLGLKYWFGFIRIQSLGLRRIDWSPVRIRFDEHTIQTKDRNWIVKIQKWIKFVADQIW